MSAGSGLLALQEAFDVDPFGRSYGLRAKSAAISTFSSSLIVDSRHQIEVGSFVHGGCLAALCEQTNRFSARAGLPDGTPVMTTDLQINYLAGASGQHLVCHADVIAVAQHGLIVDSCVYTGADTPNRMVASCRSTVAVTDGGMPSWAGTVSQESPPGIASSTTDHGWRNLIHEDFEQGWRRFCGMRPLNAAQGFVELSHIVESRHLDEHGHVLPGLIAPFADAAGGACAYSTCREGERMATLDLTLSLLNRPIRANALLGRARAIKVGKTVVVSKVEIFGLMADCEELLATSVVTVTRVPGHQRILQQLPQAAKTVAEPAFSTTEGST